MLSVTEQPNEIFYKDEGGKANTLSCTIRFPNCKSPCHVDVKLILETGEPVDNPKETLQMFTKDRRLSRRKKTLLIEWRLNKVTRRLDSKRFKLKFFLREDETISCCTRCITVLSKRKRVHKLQGESKMTTEDYLRKIISNQESILNLLRFKAPDQPELLDISWVDDLYK